MNPITLGIIIILIFFAFLYLVVRSRNLNAVNKALKNKNYTKVIALTSTSNYHKLLGDYTCELYKIKAYLLLDDKENLKKQAIQMLESKYSDANHKQFIELYYHIFLNKKNLEMVNIFLEEIKKEDDVQFVKYNQYAYDVLVDRVDNLFETMETEIEAKFYSGFSLGTVVYLIGMQYLYKDDLANAKIYFQECIDILHPSAIYSSLAKAQVEKIENEQS